ncbi:MAG: hypothetical protein IPM38_04635 [Ignavibacteria bacterium]|nr:hypothetical protein [Ignavibacteria bacterium]
MKTKLAATVIAALMLSSCSYSPDYLPESEEIDVNQYGSYISLYRNEKETIRGELIAVDSIKFIVLSKPEDSPVKTIKIIPVKEVSKYYLKYADGVSYGGAIPLFTLASLVHGYMAVITLPINLLVTIAIASSGESAFTYGDEEIKITDLKMFARFPQGLPPGIEVRGIK